MLFNNINIISKRFCSDATTSCYNIPEDLETSSNFTPTETSNTSKNTRKRQQQRTSTICLSESAKQQNLLTLFCLYFILLITLFPNTTTALRCYEKTENNKVVIKENDKWKYCALIPAMHIANHRVNASQFGLSSENESLKAYNAAFGMGIQDEYKILTVCVFEEYDFRKYFISKPEYIFRCVCNYDLCNSERTFAAYLTALYSDSNLKKSSNSDEYLTEESEE